MRVRDKASGQTERLRPSRFPSFIFPSKKVAPDAPPAILLLLPVFDSIELAGNSIPALDRFRTVFF